MANRGLITVAAGLGAGAAVAAALKASGVPWAEAGLAGGGALLLVALVGERAARMAGAHELSEAQARLEAQADALAQGLEAMNARLKQVAQTFEVSASERNARLVREMKVIEGLVSQLTRGTGAAQSAAETAPDRPAPASAAAAPVLARDHPLAELSEIELLEVIRSALEDNRIDLYLQPIVTLPQRKTKLYEGLARLRSLDGDVIEPDQFVRVAEPAGLMPIVDNLLLFRCVQIVRRLLKRHAKRAIFCNMSGRSLEDPEFFPQFLEFMAENKRLAQSLVFEFGQPTIEACSAQAEANLARLAELGFQFSLDHVAHLRLDFAWLRRCGFRYVKIGAGLCADSAAAGGADIALDNFLTLAGRNSLTVIAERVETEGDVVGVLDHDIAFGQGHLFGPPRPVRPDALADLDDAEAA